jgi:hypothetical protein
MAMGERVGREKGRGSIFSHASHATAKSRITDMETWMRDTRTKLE